LIRSTEAWTSYAISLKIKSSDADGIGVVWRFKDWDNYVWFYWTRQDAIRGISKLVGGQKTAFLRDVEPYAMNVWYDLSITVTKQTIMVAINGSRIYEYTDDTSSEVNGAVGLACFANQDCIFDNIRVQKLDTRPIVLDIDPTHGSVETVIKVTGMYFTDTEPTCIFSLYEDNFNTIVEIGGIFVSSTEVDCTIPSSAPGIEFYVFVGNDPSHPSLDSLKFTIDVPSLSQLSVNSGKTLLISGAGFTNIDIQCKFVPKESTNPSDTIIQLGVFVSSRRITCDIPSILHFWNYQVYVSNDGIFWSRESLQYGANPTISPTMWPTPPTRVRPTPPTMPAVHPTAVPTFAPSPIPSFVGPTDHSANNMKYFILVLGFAAILSFLIGGLIFYIWRRRRSARMFEASLKMQPVNQTPIPVEVEYHPNSMTAHLIQPVEESR